MKLGCNLLTQFFLFDFAVQGGAIGQYKTGIQIPRGAIIFPSYANGDTFVNSVSAYFCLNAITGGPDISFINQGHTFNNSLWLVPGAATASNEWQNTPANGGTTLLMDGSLNMLIEITSAPMTAGKFIGYIQYFIP